MQKDDNTYNQGDEGLALPDSYDSYPYLLNDGSNNQGEEGGMPPAFPDSYFLNDGGIALQYPNTSNQVNDGGMSAVANPQYHPDHVVEINFPGNNMMSGMPPLAAVADIMDGMPPNNNNALVNYYNSDYMGAEQYRPDTATAALTEPVPALSPFTLPDGVTNNTVGMPSIHDNAMSPRVYKSEELSSEDQDDGGDSPNLIRKRKKKVMVNPDYIKRATKKRNNQLEVLETIGGNGREGFQSWVIKHKEHIMSSSSSSTGLLFLATRADADKTVPDKIDGIPAFGFERFYYKRSRSNVKGNVVTDEYSIFQLVHCALNESEQIPYQIYHEVVEEGDDEYVEYDGYQLFRLCSGERPSTAERNGIKDAVEFIAKMDMFDCVKLKMKGDESSNQRYIRVGSFLDGEDELDLSEIPLFEVKPSKKKKTVPLRLSSVKQAAEKLAKKNGQADKFQVRQIFKNEDSTVFIYQKRPEDVQNPATGKNQCAKASCKEDAGGGKHGRLCPKHFLEVLEKRSEDRKKKELEKKVGNHTGGGKRKAR